MLMKEAEGTLYDGPDVNIFIHIISFTKTDKNGVLFCIGNFILFSFRE